jgi:tripartite-type tricarboxylate transporter receptor subunit TctC
MDRRKFLQAALAAGGAAGLITAPVWAQGQAWPDKPLRWILSQPPGSGPDNVARMLGEHTARDLGQGVVIDNKPGGQNVIGAQAAAHAAADGYTFYFATTAALVTNSFLFKDLSYDPQKDFTPVAFVAISPFAVLVRAESPITSIQDLVARSKAAPGRLSLGNEGPRTFGGIIARLLNARTGMQANLVPYASVSISLADLMGGHIDAAVADLASSAQLVRDGKLRLLAVSSAKRIAGWEQTPALAELLPGFEMVGWFGLVAPTGTPPAVVTRMSREFNALLADKEMAERILNVGPIVEPGGTPEKFGAFLQEERGRWAQVAKEIGLLPE